jgi:hypothetical protein
MHPLQDTCPRTIVHPYEFPNGSLIEGTASYSLFSCLLSSIFIGQPHWLSDFILFSLCISFPSLFLVFWWNNAQRLVEHPQEDEGERCEREHEVEGLNSHEVY